jgi:hypothetical protein
MTDANDQTTDRDSTMKTQFSLGRIVITAAAHEAISAEEAILALSRHAGGDWGDLCEHDREENEFALAHGYRLFARYLAANGTRFWIITEADRSATTILLPDDY